jgi:hypothetical protein
MRMIWDTGRSFDLEQFLSKTASSSFINTGRGLQ